MVDFDRGGGKILPKEMAPSPLYWRKEWKEKGGLATPQHAQFVYTHPDLIRVYPLLASICIYATTYGIHANGCL